MYAKVGRPSIPPEQLLRAQLLHMLYSIRSERLLMEEIDYSMLFRWFIGLNLDDGMWDATVFTKNRDRLLEAEVVITQKTILLLRVIGFSLPESHKRRLRPCPACTPRRSSKTGSWQLIYHNRDLQFGLNTCFVKRGTGTLRTAA